MRSIASMTLLFIILGLTAFVYAATPSRGGSSITREYSRPAILCLNHKLSTESADVSRVARIARLSGREA
ncbi:MAG: hypothetical protein WAW37_00420 [Syntrophobacteraceae bacterium]